MGRTGTEFVKTRSEQELNRSEIVKRKQHVRSEYPVLQFTDLECSSHRILFYMDSTLGRKNTLFNRPEGKMVYSCRLHSCNRKHFKYVFDNAIEILCFFVAMQDRCS
jgi:hypothetical protein